MNAAWTHFAQENGAAPASTGAGLNYLNVCRRSLPTCPEVQRVLAGIQAVIDGTAESFRCEYSCDSPYQQRWFEMRVKPLQQPQGGVVVCHSDISELRKARDEYSAVLEGAQAILWRAKPPDFQTTYVSKHVEKILGYPPEIWLKQRGFWREHIHPEDRDWVLAHTTQATQEKRSHDFEYRMIAANGQTVWLRNIVNVVVETGQVAELVGVSVDISERKRQEEEASQASRQHKATIDSITDGLLVMDRDWRYTFFSERAAQILGMKREDMLGRVVWDLFPQAKGTKFYELYHQAVETGEPQHFEEYYPEPLNQWLECHCYPSDEALTVYFHDVTDRKRAEDSLRQSELQFRTLAEAIPQLCWMANPDGWIFWYNRRWYDYTGTTPDEMEGWGWRSLHDPEALPSVLERWKKSIETGEPFEMVFPLRRADGSFGSFLTRVMPLKDSDGKVLRWFGTNTDVTELRDTQEALRASEERLRIAYRAARIGAFELNIETGVNNWTPELEAMYGLRPGSFDKSQAAFERLVHADDRDKVQSLVEHALETGQPTEGEWRVVWPDGSVHWIAGRWQALRDPSGRAVRMAGVNMDITERKKAQDALASFGGRLIEAQEEERKRIARELHDDINQRIAALAIDLAKSDQHLPGSATETHDQIHKMWERLSHIASDIQALSHRLHSSKLEYLGIVMAATSFCKEFSDQHKVEIDFTHAGIPHDLPKQISLCLFRVLQEALQNAVKYSGVRHFIVALRGTSGEIQLSVTDQGVGFNAEDVQTHHGLGLISMRERLQLVNGQFSINSAPGRGTTVTARIPLKAECIEPATKFAVAH